MERDPVVKKVSGKTGEPKLYSAYICLHDEVLGVSVSLASMDLTSTPDTVKICPQSSSSKFYSLYNMTPESRKPKV